MLLDSLKVWDPCELGCGLSLNAALFTTVFQISKEPIVLNERQMTQSYDEPREDLFAQSLLKPVLSTERVPKPMGFLEDAVADR